jgi:hypothetical protein
MRKIITSILSLMILFTGFINVQAEEEQQPIQLSFEIWDNEGPVLGKSVIKDSYFQEKLDIWQEYDLPEDRYMVVLVRNEVDHPYFETYQVRDNMYSWDSHNKFKTIEEAEAWARRLGQIQVDNWNNSTRLGYTMASKTGYRMAFVEPSILASEALKPVIPEPQLQPIEITYEIWDNKGPINGESFLSQSYLDEWQDHWTSYIPDDRFIVVLIRNENHPYISSTLDGDNWYGIDTYNKFKTLEEAEAWGQRLAGIKVQEWNEYVHKWGYTNAEVSGYTMVFVEPSEFKKENILAKDKTAPVTSASEVPANWTNEDVAITLTASDENSGVAKTEYRINESEWIQYTGPIISLQEGINVIKYRSIDQAGNIEETKSVEVKIDKTAPSLNVSFNQTVITDRNHKLTPIKAMVEADDVLSGIASIELVSITSNQHDNGKGDGNTFQDIQGTEFGTFDTEFLIRAERSGSEDRIYTITYTVTDIAGNSTDCNEIIVIKHDNSKK